MGKFGAPRRPERPPWAGTRGPVAKDAATAAQNCRKLVARLVSKVRHRYQVWDPPASTLRRTSRPAVASDERRRAPAASVDKLTKLLLARHDSCTLTRTFQRARGGVGGYAVGLRLIQKLLLTDLDITIGRNYVFVNTLQALSTYIYLAEKDQMLHPSPHQPSLLLFIDGCDAFYKNDSHVICFSLPTAKQPHQLLMQLAVARWVGRDTPFEVLKIFRKIGLLDTLKKVLGQGINRKKLRLLASLDWKMIRTLANWGPPGAPQPCPFCFATKAQFKAGGFQGATSRSHLDWDSPLKDLLHLIDHTNDIVYDPLHCCALVLGHAICGALFFFFKQHQPEKVDQLVSLFQQVFGDQNPYVPPVVEAVGRDDWVPNNKQAKAALHDDIFWANVLKLLPSNAQGLQVGDPRSDGILVDPVHRYVHLMRMLSLDVLSWTPQFVAERTTMCHEAHMLYYALAFTDRRYTVATHYFLFHYGEILKRHGNLLSISSEGGEHLHTPHKRYIKMSSFVAWACPRGVVEALTWSVRNLAFWRQRIRLPASFFEVFPTLPPA